jgi:siroheme synthase (precorrin-2 oxidase/ferrochelatase)
MNVLVIALDAAPLDLHDADVLVVAPALNSRLRHWLSDEDEARRRAEVRADACVEQLVLRGAHANGRIGDADPLQAIADALPTFAADEVVIAAADDRVAARARERFPIPIRSTDQPSGMGVTVPLSWFATQRAPPAATDSRGSGPV